MANKVRTLFANMSWMLIAQVITSVLAFVWTILTARYLGPSEYGIFGTAISFSTIFLVIIDVGILTYSVRAISTDLENEGKYLNNAFSISLFLSVIYLIVIFIAIMILGWSNYILIICLLYAIQTVINRLASLYAVSFQAHEQMKYNAILNILGNVSIFVFILFVIFLDLGLFGIMFSYIISSIISLGYVLLIITKYFFKPEFSVNLSCYKQLIKGGIPFAMSGLFVTIYYSIDVIMITQFVGTYEAGLYNAAYKLINIFTIFYTVYGTVVFPVMSKLFKDSKDMLHLSFIKSMKYLLLVTIPIAVFTCFYSYDIICIYGSEFYEASGVLGILIWTVCFLFVNGASGLVLNASHKELSVTKILGITALFNIVLNLFLIPKYSYYGASIATVLSEILLCVFQMYIIYKVDQLPEKQFAYDIIKICLASGILAIALYFLNLNLWLAMPVSIVIYFAAIFLLKTPDNEDKIILKQILNR